LPRAAFQNITQRAFCLSLYESSVCKTEMEYPRVPFTNASQVGSTSSLLCPASVGVKPTQRTFFSLSSYPTKSSRDLRAPSVRLSLSNYHEYIRMLTHGCPWSIVRGYTVILVESSVRVWISLWISMGNRGYPCGDMDMDSSTRDTFRTRIKFTKTYLDQANRYFGQQSRETPRK